MLQNKTFFQLSGSPDAFRQLVLAQPKSRWIIVDEVQRLPSLLNEVHSLMEDEGYKFALTGSSARKLKRGQANLLAGRASVRSFFPIVYSEAGKAWKIEDVLAWGCLPAVLADPGSRLDILDAYAGTYVREEIKEEALTRNVDAFSRFLEVAALANAQVTNLSSISRDAHVARATVDTYFSILEDTLLGSFLPAFRARARVKEVSHPKFYFFDTGVLRSLQGRLRDAVGNEERGHLLETYLFHELRAHDSYASLGGKFSYWRTVDQVEVDFLWTRGSRHVAIEAKASARWRPEFDAGFRALAGSKVKLTAAFGVYLGDQILKKDWGFVLPVAEFLRRLAENEILA